MSEAVSDDLRPIRDGAELIRNQPRPFDPTLWAAFADWDPAQHPRAPQGTPGGGRFVSAKELLDAAKKFMALPDKEDEYRHRDLHAEGEWTPKGKSRSAYGAVLFNDKGQVLVREPTNHFGGYNWTIGGKGGQDGDESPVDTAKREVLEETGQHIQIVGHVPGGHTYGSVHQWLEYPSAPAEPSTPAPPSSPAGRKLVTHFGGHPTTADFKAGDKVQHWKYGSGTVVGTTKSKVLVRKGWNLHLDDPAELRHHPSMYGQSGTDGVAHANDLIGHAPPTEPQYPGEPVNKVRLPGPPKVHISDTTQNSNYYLARPVGEQDPEAMDEETNQTRWVGIEDAADLLSESPNAEGRQRMLDTLNSAWNEYRRLTGLEAAPDASVGTQVTSGGGTGAVPQEHAEPSPVWAFAKWEEELHPRAPGGGPHGGEFIKKVGFGNLLNDLFKPGDEVYALNPKTKKLEKKTVKTPFPSQPHLVGFKADGTYETKKSPYKHPKYVAHVDYVNSLTKEEHLAKAHEEESKPKPDPKLVAAHKAAAEITTKVSAPKAEKAPEAPHEEPEAPAPPAPTAPKHLVKDLGDENNHDFEVGDHVVTEDGTKGTVSFVSPYAHGHVSVKTEDGPTLSALPEQIKHDPEHYDFEHTPEPLVNDFNQASSNSQFYPGEHVVNKNGKKVTVVGPKEGTDNVVMVKYPNHDEPYGNYAHNLKHDHDAEPIAEGEKVPGQNFQNGTAPHEFQPNDLVTDSAGVQGMVAGPADEDGNLPIYWSGPHAGNPHSSLTHESPESLTPAGHFEPGAAPPAAHPLDEEDKLSIIESAQDEAKAQGVEFHNVTADGHFATTPKSGDMFAKPTPDGVMVGTVDNVDEFGAVTVHDTTGATSTLISPVPPPTTPPEPTPSAAPVPPAAKTVTEFGSGTAADFKVGDKVTTQTGLEGTVSGTADDTGKVPVEFPVPAQGGPAQTIPVSPSMLIHSTAPETPEAAPAPPSATPLPAEELLQGVDETLGTKKVVADFSPDTKASDFATGDHVVDQQGNEWIVQPGTSDVAGYVPVASSGGVEEDINPATLKHDPDFHAAPAAPAAEPPKLVTGFSSTSKASDFKAGDKVVTSLGVKGTVDSVTNSTVHVATEPPPGAEHPVADWSYDTKPEDFSVGDHVLCSTGTGPGEKATVTGIDPGAGVGVVIHFATGDHAMTLHPSLVKHDPDFFAADADNHGQAGGWAVQTPLPMMPSGVKHDPEHQAENIANHTGNLVSTYDTGKATDFKPGQQVLLHWSDTEDRHGNVLDPSDPSLSHVEVATSAGLVPVSYTEPDGTITNTWLAPAVLKHDPAQAAVNTAIAQAATPPPPAPPAPTPPVHLVTGIHEGNLGDFKVGDHVVDETGFKHTVTGISDYDLMVETPDGNIQAYYLKHDPEFESENIANHLAAAPPTPPTPAAPAPGVSTGLTAGSVQGIVTDPVLHVGDKVENPAGDLGTITGSTDFAVAEVDWDDGTHTQELPQDLSKVAEAPTAAPGAAPPETALVTDFNQAGASAFKQGDAVVDPQGNKWIVQPPEASQVPGYVPIAAPGDPDIHDDIHPANLMHDPDHEAENLANHGAPAPPAPLLAGGVHAGDKTVSQGYTYEVLGPGTQPNTVALHITTPDGFEQTQDNVEPSIIQALGNTTGGWTPAAPAATGPGAKHYVSSFSPDTTVQDFEVGDHVVTHDVRTEAHGGIGQHLTVEDYATNGTQAALHGGMVPLVDENGNHTALPASSLKHDPKLHPEAADYQTGDWVTTADGKTGTVITTAVPPGQTTPSILVQTVGPGDGKALPSWYPAESVSPHAAETGIDGNFAVGDTVFHASNPGITGTITGFSGPDNSKAIVQWHDPEHPPADTLQTMTAIQSKKLVNVTHPPVPDSPATTFYGHGTGAFKPGEKVQYGYGGHTATVVSHTDKTVKIKLDPNWVGDSQGGKIKNVKPGKLKHQPSAYPHGQTPVPGAYAVGYTPSSGYHPAAPHTPTPPAPSAPAPPPNKLPSSFEEMSGWEKVGGLPVGSNPGQWYQAPDGTRFYAKEQKDAAHAYNEVGALAAYQAAGLKPGVDYPHAKVVTDPSGKAYVVSQEIPGLTSKTQSWWSGHPEAQREAARLTAINALTSHYDAAGQEMDNLLVDADNHPVLIEAGGAMAYRARGEEKATWNTAAPLLGEVRSVTGKNPQFPNSQMAAVFGNQGDLEIATQLHQIANDPGYVQRVDDIWKAQGMPEAQRAENRAVLEERIHQIPETIRTLAPEGLQYGQGTALGVGTVDPWEGWVKPVGPEVTPEAAAQVEFHADVNPIGPKTEDELHEVEGSLKGDIPDSYEAISALQPTTGPDLGAIKGTYYKDEQGHVFNVKEAPSLAYAQNQVASNIAYAMAGAQPGQTIAPTRVVQSADGKAYVVQQIPEDADVRDAAWWNEHPVTKNAMANQWAMDALLSNWNVAGTGSLNKVVVGESQQPIRVNTGGAMAFGTTGGPKTAWSPTGIWSEPWTMRGKNYEGVSGNDGAKAIFGEISDDEAADRLESLQGLNLDYMESAWRAAGVPEDQIEKNLAVIQARLGQMREVVTKLRTHASVAGSTVPALGEYEPMPSEHLSGPPPLVAPKEAFTGIAEKMTRYHLEAEPGSTEAYLPGLQGPSEGRVVVDGTISGSDGPQAALIINTASDWTGTQQAVIRRDILHGHPTAGGTALFQAVDAAPARAPKLTRGFDPHWTHAEVEKRYPVGQVITQNICGFSDNPNWHWGGYGSTNHVHIDFHLAPGAKAINITPHSGVASEHEWLTQGEFEVERIEWQDPTYAHIYLRQIATCQRPPVPETIASSEAARLLGWQTITR